MNKLNGSQPVDGFSKIIPVSNYNFYFVRFAASIKVKLILFGWRQLCLIYLQVFNTCVKIKLDIGCLILTFLL